MEQLKCFEEDLLLSRIQNSRARQIAESLERRTIFYRYSQADQILETILIPRFLRADITRNDRGLIYFLYGDYHTGKSFLLKYYASFMRRNFSDYWIQAEMPIIKVDLNNHINTAEQLLLFLLDYLGRPIDYRIISQWKKTGILNYKLQDRLICLLEELGTRVLILDESQKLLKSRNPDISDIFELLKDLTTRHHWHGDLRTQIILCGTKDGIPMLEAAEWIQGRTQITKLKELEMTDYGVLLFKIYRDYTKNLHISEEFYLVEVENNKPRLNKELALYLYQRTRGKVGLTVDLIRNATLLALDEGRFFPDKKDFDRVKLEDKSYTIQYKTKNTHLKEPQKQIIRPRLHDRICLVPRCDRSKKPYSSGDRGYSSLINHYRNKHPQIKLVFGDEK